MIKAVIFDMDGVLIDTEPVYLGWFKGFLDAYGIKVEEKEFHTMAGASQTMEKKLLKKWWDDNKKEDISGEEIYQLCEKYWATKGDDDIDFKKIQMPYVHETLGILKNKGYKVALASSSPMSNIRHVIKELNISSFLDVVVSGEMFKESKPNPEIYNHTVEILECLPEECVAVEDSTYGIKAAKAANLLTIAKKDDRFNFQQESADYKINELIDVIDIIK